MKTKKRNTKTPKLRYHKATGQAYCVLNGHVIYFGSSRTCDSTDQYHKVIAEWLANGKQPNTSPSDVTINEMLAFGCMPKATTVTPMVTRPQSLEISVFPCDHSTRFMATQRPWNLDLAA